MLDRTSPVGAILIKAGQVFYAICLAVQGILQLIYGDFRPAILPEWTSQNPALVICARVGGAALLGACIAIVMGKRGREVALILGGLFLASVLFCQIPYALLVNPRSINLFSWGGPFNALVMAGCSFVVAASYTEGARNAARQSSLLRGLEKVMPFGRILFCITILRFGIGHFLHTKHDAALIPGWIPWHMFWTYFTGAALVGSGAAVIAKIKLRPVAALLATMLFLWVVMLHVPRAIADPYSGQGNEIESAAHALADSGTALLIACSAWCSDRLRRTIGTQPPRDGHGSLIERS
ncbi:MAG: hypothetical protein WAN28_11400 [Terracidiphilus sp.]